MSPRSVRLAHQVLQQAFAKAVQWKLTANNPLASGIILPRMEPKEMKTLSAEDAKAFLDATADDRLGPLWCLLLTTGLRRGEALGLRWSDVDLADARLEVRQTVVAVKGTPLISEPKTKTGRRTVYLSGRTIEALKDQRARQKADRKLVGSAWEDSGLVFTTTTGGLLHPRNVLRDFQIALGQGQPAQGPAPRPPPHRGHAAAPRRRSPQGGPGVARPRQRGHHAEHLLACHPRTPPGGRRHARGRAQALIVTISRRASTGTRRSRSPILTQGSPSAPPVASNRRASS